MATGADLKRLRRFIALRVPLGIAALTAALLAVAGTLRYWQAWTLGATMLVVWSAVGTYFLRTDPDFLMHRLQFREKEQAQKRIVRLFSLLYLGILFVPALDIRLGWSSVRAEVSLAALAVFLLTYGLVLWVFKTNRYASRIIEVQPNQRVIDTGPYALVRHPMYAAQLVMFLAFMLALGSWWGALVSVGLLIPLVMRIKNEEAVLRRDLPGYQAYCLKTRFRLIPYVW